MDNLNIYTNNQITDRLNNRRLPEKIKDLLFGPKIVFVILGVVVLIEIIYAARVLISPASSSLSAGQTANQTIGRISLTTPKTTVKVNETIPVVVAVNTGSYAVDGIDLVVNFDPKILEVIPEELNKGKLLDEYPLVAANIKTGVISISGISNKDSGFKGTGEFAYISFRAKQKGQTSLTVNFQKGSTANSNLVEVKSSKNILEQVDNLQLTIQ